MDDRRKFLKRTVAMGTACVVTSPTASGRVFQGQQKNALQGRMLDAVVDFGCDNSGVSNTTSKLKAFYDACIVSGTSGYIPAGIYLITEGKLVFETSFQEKPWPNIFTAGHQFVSFKFAGVVDAPLLTWSNGLANSTVGKYWVGGGHGGVSFLGANNLAFSQSHAISLTGVWGFNFGWLRGAELRGDLVHLPSRRYEKNNPDPYACSFLEFEGLEANHCLGKVVGNYNSLGLAHWSIKRLRATNAINGVWLGYGSGVEIAAVSIGSCAGWAFDDASYLNESDGPSLRFYIRYAELDNVQFGFRLNRLTMFDLNGVRFVHRHNFGANRDEGYWPRVAFDIAGGKRASVAEGRIDCVHRLESGGSKSALGVFLSGNNCQNFSNCQVEQIVLDQFDFDLADDELYSNIHSSSMMQLTNAGRVIYDMTERVVVVARGGVGKSVVRFGGFGTLNSKISFPKINTVNAFQAARCYDSVESVFTVPYLGMYQIDVNIPMKLPVGARVRIGIATADKVLSNTVETSHSNEIQHYRLRDILQLKQGVKIFVVAEQNAFPDAKPVVWLSQDEISFSIVAL